MGRGNGECAEVSLSRRGAATLPATVCAICKNDVAAEKVGLHERDFGHPFVAAGSYKSLPLTDEDIERYQHEGRTDRIDCACGRTEFVRPGRGELREPWQMDLCIECLRKSGWSLPQQHPMDRRKPRTVSYAAKPYLPVEHRAQIEQLQHHFLRQNRWGTALEEFKGLGELLERTLAYRGHLDGDDREFLYQQGADPRSISNDCRYLICPVGSASERRFVTLVFAPNTAENASTEELVADVFDGVPSERAVCALCERPIVGAPEQTEAGPACVSCTDAA